MKTYYIFRHAETFATLKNRGYGLKILSAPILETGKPAIEKMANFLKDIPSQYNASSPLRRCLQTTQIITGKTGKQFMADKRLSEFFLETFGHFRARIQSFLSEMENSDHQTILVCTHGAVLGGLIAFLTKKDFRAGDLLEYPPPGILIKIENGLPAGRQGKVEEFDFNLRD